MAPAELFRDAALADGRGPQLVTPVSVLVRDGILAEICNGEVPDRVLRNAVVSDASGATVVPAFVDCHSHLTLPGGARWMEHGTGPTPDLLAAAEENAAALMRSGVRWVRDVGSVRRADAPGGKERALALPLRDQWNGRPGYPCIRAAWTWLSKAGTLPDARLSVEAADADQLLAAASQQLDEGADLVKLYLDGPDAGVAPWTVSEVGRVVEAVHARGATVAAHATRLANCRLAADAAVDTLEHGNPLNDPGRRLAHMADHRLVPGPAVHISAEGKVNPDPAGWRRPAFPAGRRKASARRRTGQRLP
jgi:imidazolonepropionase-like amidohydrolase